MATNNEFRVDRIIFLAQLSSFTRVQNLGDDTLWTEVMLLFDYNYYFLSFNNNRKQVNVVRDG